MTMRDIAPTGDVRSRTSRDNDRRPSRGKYAGHEVSIPAALGDGTRLGMISGACSPGSGNPTGTGGSSSGGGHGRRTTGSGGTGATCSERDGLRRQRGRNLDRDLVVPDAERGTWTSRWRASIPRTCTNVTISGSLDVSGTWTANANGTYTDGTTTTGTAQLDLPAGCLMLSGTTIDCDGIGGPSKGWASPRHLHERREAAGARARPPSTRRAGSACMSVGPADERQLHDVGQHAHAPTDAGDEATPTASRETR